MRYNGVLLCELDLEGQGGGEEGVLGLFTVLYPIIFKLNGSRKGKQGLNGTFHMWSNSGLTPGYEYHLSVGFLVGLLLSCVSLKSKGKKTKAELFSFYKAAKNMVEFSNHLFQCSKAIILLLESNINVSPVNLLQVIICWAFPHG